MANSLFNLIMDHSRNKFKHRDGLSVKRKKDSNHVILSNHSDDFSNLLLFL